MILNKGWFTNASSRAMMVHSRLFDLFPAEGEDVIGKEGAAVMLNQTARYAKVKTVSEKVTDKERKKISIKIEQHMQMLFLEIKNGTDKLPAKSGHTFLTSKQDKSLHGYGLKSVERIVTRYDGDLAYEMEDGMFVVSITFFDL